MEKHYQFHNVCKVAKPESPTNHPRIEPNKKNLSSYPNVLARPTCDEFFPSTHKRSGYTYYEPKPFLKKSFHVASTLHNSRVKGACSDTYHQFPQRHIEEIYEESKKMEECKSYAQEMKKRYQKVMRPDLDFSSVPQECPPSKGPHYKLHTKDCPVRKAACRDKVLLPKIHFGKSHPLTYVKIHIQSEK